MILTESANTLPAVIDRDIEEYLHRPHRMLDLRYLAAAQEVANALDIAETELQPLHIQKRLPHFPAPLTKLACARIWDLRDVLLWAVRYPREYRYARTGQPIAPIVRRLKRELKAVEARGPWPKAVNK